MTSPHRPRTPLDAETLLAQSAWLARLARALVARNDEIDDIVQQTFAQALAYPPRHTGNIRAHHLFRYAYDSCAIDATFQKLIASNEDIAQPPSSKLYCASVYMQGA